MPNNEIVSVLSFFVDFITYGGFRNYRDNYLSEAIEKSAIDPDIRFDSETGITKYREVDLETGAAKWVQWTYGDRLYERLQHEVRAVLRSFDVHLLKQESAEGIETLIDVYLRRIQKLKAELVRYSDLEGHDIVLRALRYLEREIPKTNSTSVETDNANSKNQKDSPRRGNPAFKKILSTDQEAWLVKYAKQLVEADPVVYKSGQEGGINKRLLLELKDEVLDLYGINIDETTIWRYLDNHGLRKWLKQRGL